MSVKEIQNAIIQLPGDELDSLLEWVEDYQEQLWDEQIRRDAKAGRFDRIFEQIREQRRAGQCKPL